MGERSPQPQIIYDSSLKSSSHRVVVDAKLCGEFLSSDGATQDQINDSVVRIKHFSLRDLRDYTFQIGEAGFDRSVSIFADHPYIRLASNTLRKREDSLNRILAHELRHLADILTDPEGVKKSTSNLTTKLRGIEAITVTGFAVAERFWSNSLYNDLRLAGAAFAISGLAGLVAYCGNEAERRAEETAIKFMDKEKRRLVTITKRIRS